MLTFFLGGVRSGKSLLAEAAATRLAGVHGLPVVYVATATASDDEMALRIARHRRRRPSEWSTVEAGAEPEAALGAADREGAVLLLDCLSLWLAALLDHLDAEALARDLVARLARRRSPSVVVSLEAGLGLVPPDPTARRFLDLLGETNAALAEAADAVVLVVAGRTLALKGAPP